MNIIPATDTRSYRALPTDDLRKAFLIADLFRPGKIQLHHWETDRAVIGAAVPTRGRLALPTAQEIAAAFFCERRELGIINLGEAGTVEVDGTRYELGLLDCLYVGRGAQKVFFSSKKPAKPARFYLLSYPAHTAYPTTLARREEAQAVELGASVTANQRTLCKFIHPGGIRSCQLVMGFTSLKAGSVWNTMPPHTHSRRSEVYLYFGVSENAAIFHFMGPPHETRHLVVREGQAVLSPPWSIHCGAGSESYSFVWGMGGENQEFSDMDPAPLQELR